MQFVSDPLPWWGWSPPTSLSIVSLIESGVISADGAAALWWALEEGASVFVAAGPQGAGKTTTATALFPFLPREARAYVTAGPLDPLSLPAGGGAPTYLLVNELSSHMPIYLSGPAARRAFALLRDGVRMVGTLHADSAEEAVHVMRYQAGIPAEDTARITLAVVLRVWRSGGRLVRRIVEIGLLQPGADPRVVPVAAWDDPAGPLELQPAPGGTAALAAWAGVASAEVEQAVTERAAFLSGLASAGVHAPAEVNAAVWKFVESKHSGM